MTPDTDIAIVGSGFGASLMAMVARRLGFRVVMLERGRHPRFAIGESASPLAGILLEQLSDRYDLPRVRPLSAYGTWQRTYPEIVCGLKRGFTFFRHQPGRRYEADVDRSNQLLVAASPDDELSDTHWLRSDVDHFLVDEAVSLGVDYLDRVDLDGIEWQAGGTPVLTGTREGQRLRIRASFVIDGSGPRGFLSRALGIADRGFDGYPPTQALFSHFVDVARCEEMDEYGAGGRRGDGAEVRVRRCDGGTVGEVGFDGAEPAHQPRTVTPSHLRTRTSAPSPLHPPAPHALSSSPYPIDAAALHHVIDGGWMWVLRFGNGVVSAGLAAEDWLAAELRLGDGAPAWERLMERYPSVAAQFVDARPIRDFTWMRRMPYRAATAAGPGWAMLPSAAAFVDPLFSTGIPLTLLGIERLGRALEEGPRVLESVRGTGLSLAGYGDRTLADADRAARFVAGSYAGFRRFDLFTAYSMFYFAAASYTEMARRLSSPRTPGAFLCGDSPAFVSALEQLSPLVRGEADASRYRDDVAAAIEGWNVAGLCSGEKRNWYGVDLQDTVRAADKLGLTEQEVRVRLAQTAAPATS